MAGRGRGHRAFGADRSVEPPGPLREIPACIDGAPSRQSPEACPRRPSTGRDSTSCSPRSSGAATRSSARPCATARSSTTSSTRRPTCRPAGPTCRTAAPTASRAATTRRCSATTSGPNSWKSYLFPADAARSGRRAGAPTAASRSRRTPAAPPRYAFIGVRSCDLHAIAVQDRVFLDGALRRPRLPARGARARSSSRSTAARPAAPASASRWTPGPRATAGFDLALTEVLEDGGHRFLVEVGSERGAEVLAELPHREAAADDELAAAERAIENAAAQMGRDARHRRHQGAALPQPRAPALGRGRRPLPDLRQLHDGLPDLLLHARSRT